MGLSSWPCFILSASLTLTCACLLLYRVINIFHWGLYILLNPFVNHSVFCHRQKEWGLFHLHLATVFDCQIISNDLRTELQENRGKVLPLSIFCKLKGREKECFLSTLAYASRTRCFIKKRQDKCNASGRENRNNAEKAMSDGIMGAAHPCILPFQSSCPFFSLNFETLSEIMRRECANK